MCRQPIIAQSLAIKTSKSESVTASHSYEKNSCQFKQPKTSLISTVSTLGVLLLLALLPVIPCNCRVVMDDNNRSGDLLCNDGEDHECVCSRSRGDLDDIKTACDRLLEVKKLTVVSMAMRDIDLNARLYTNETYQQYLRRRIANILSQYCERQIGDCPGTVADARYLRKVNPTTDRYAPIFFDEDEPVFLRENILILKVNFSGNKRVEVQFAVTKMRDVQRLSNDSVMDPTKVKYILSAQAAPLSRVLGGVKIEELKLAQFKKAKPPYDNTRLIAMLAVVISGILICWIVALIKIILTKRANRPRQDKETLTEKKSTRNYGTCTEKLLSNYDLPNGRAKSISSRESNSLKLKKKKVSTNEVATMIIVEECKDMSAEVSPKSFPNIFACDHSQLPKEAEAGEDEDVFVGRRRSSVRLQYDGESFFPDQITTEKRFFVEEREAVEKSARNPLVTCVMMGSSMSSTDTTSQETIINVNTGKQTSAQLGGGGFLKINEDHPFERPLSRRGSRDFDNEEGEEETYSSREDTPQPLGDDEKEDEIGIEVPVPLPPKIVENAQEIKEKPLSSNESEFEEDRDAYNRLSGNEGGKDEDFETENILSPKITNNFSHTLYSAGDSSSDEETDDAVTDSARIERHRYMRLEESPIPPKIVAELSTDPIILSEDYLDS